jgi:hypothetical protein
MNDFNDAREQIHPLLRNTEPHRLGQRTGFVLALKCALERRIAQAIAVFQFDESWMENRTSWDGSIHLPVKVPRLSHLLEQFARSRDQGLVDHLRRSGWSRLRDKQTMLEIQQVTPGELQHCIGYGAMFYAVYGVPVQVWRK